MSSYCIIRRGPNAYDPDCHKFVECWDGRAFLKSCHPRNLVFNPLTRQCTWPHDPAVRGRCQSKVNINTGYGKSLKLSN